jgi:eukaryotic-like serine/threonine-protein kinase
VDLISGKPRAERPTAPVAEVYGPELEAGTAVGDLVVEGLAGRGGFASVYRARHRANGAPAALKILARDLRASGSILRRFVREAEAIRSLRHPDIVEIGDCGALDDGRPYVAMEWLDGASLRGELLAGGPLSAGEALALFEALASPLDAAHTRGLIHRDLRAENVFVLARRPAWRIKLADFGVARFVEPVGGRAGATSGSLFGTPATMAPEQLRDQPVDARADIHALGHLLTDVLTGSLPGPDGPEAAPGLVLAGPFPRGTREVAVPRALDSVVARCLARDREDRYPSVNQFMTSLRRALEPEPAERAALAVYVDARIGSNAGEGALDHALAMVVATRRCLVALGMEIAHSTDTSLLAVVELPEERGGAARERRRLIEAASHLADLAQAHVPAALTARFFVHAGPVRRDPSGGFVLDELLRFELWSSGLESGGSAVTQAAGEGLDLALAEPFAAGPSIKAYRLRP